MRLVNNNKGIEFQGTAYVDNTEYEAKNMQAGFKTEDRIHKVLFDTCVEITEPVMSIR